MFETFAGEAERPYTFRPFTPDDVPFIQNSWGQSYYKGASYDHYLAPEEFHRYHRPIRERFLSKANHPNPYAHILIATAKDDSTLIMGFVAYEKPQVGSYLIIHYIYVKQAFKGLKVASELLQAVKHPGPIIVTHMTERAARIMSKKSHKYDRYFYAPHIV